MGEKKLMKGCEALGEAAIQAGARAFFGYPITPQTEVPEYLSKRLPEVGGVFLQAESEVASSNMLYGAAGAGARVFTSTSSPGYSLMAEGISYIAGSELPAVIINIVRGGPGLGGILPSQGDYHQATKGAGHGDYKNPVLAPSTVQEAADLMMEAFDIADTYRNPVIVMGDGLIGQMMEPVQFKAPIDPVTLPKKEWATTGAKNRPPNIINSLYLDAPTLEKHNIKLHAKYERIQKELRRFEEYGDDGQVDLLIVAYGTVARVSKTATDDLIKSGKKVAVFRPITLWPFPDVELERRAAKAKRVLVVELSMGQMVDDVKAAVGKEKSVSFFGRGGGSVCSPEEVRAVAERVLDGEELYVLGDPLKEEA
ncbi:MAG: 3-methyl-2-oxobutanoate dehydrogenase subunit VorB [Deltaproteobacteria bacterium RIFOXYB12_FULL_58_9]|nr:MAG: 3-methyl-2-oxobutanoate dehydrogenase subunit VorB [Deltaproteobacteria bacterium RIFOXYB12_FULL_58_9]